jgi:hypothetical protein
MRAILSAVGRQRLQSPAWRQLAAPYASPTGRESFGHSPAACRRGVSAAAARVEAQSRAPGARPRDLLRGALLGASWASMTPRRSGEIRMRSSTDSSRVRAERGSSDTSSQIPVASGGSSMKPFSKPSSPPAPRTSAAPGCAASWAARRRSRWRARLRRRLSRLAARQASSVSSAGVEVSAGAAAAPLRAGGRVAVVAVALAGLCAKALATAPAMAATVRLGAFARRAASTAAARNAGPSPAMAAKRRAHVRGAERRNT